MRLTGECVLEEEWMTDICISFGMRNHWTFQFIFKQNFVCVLKCLSSPLESFVIYLSFMLFILVNVCGCVSC